jgi:hypothetical protein
VRLDEEERYGDFHQVLRIERNGVVIEEQQDGGEPEDQSFCRDWAWVPEALKKAYAFGLEDGRREAAPLAGDGGKDQGST